MLRPTYIRENRGEKAPEPKAEESETKPKKRPRKKKSDS